MKIYETPMLEISTLASSDVITASTGSTPFTEFEWSKNDERPRSRGRFQNLPLFREWGWHKAACGYPPARM